MNFNIVVSNMIKNLKYDREIQDAIKGLYGKTYKVNIVGSDEQTYPIELINNHNEYLLMYTNASDKSNEIVKIDFDGLVKNKVKKLKNDYYNITSFNTYNNTIYFVGQITCPEDETCDYDSNSLFIIITLFVYIVLYYTLINLFSQPYKIRKIFQQGRCKTLMYINHSPIDV